MSSYYSIQSRLCIAKPSGYNWRKTIHRKINPTGNPWQAQSGAFILWGTLLHNPFHAYSASLITG